MAWFLPKLASSTRLLCAAGLESLWVIAENINFMIDRYRAAAISLNYYGDSIFNFLSDICFCLSTFWLASRLPWRITLGAFLLLEVALAIAIRDNLVLNILMLIVPIEGIEVWQQGLN